jgi:galactose-1-phosphate uridylyltransferase
MMDWEQAEKELQTLREMMRQTLASLDNPQQNMEYYMDLARQVSELHDEIEDRLHVGRHFLSNKYITRPVNGTHLFTY